jgi:hypothetical protein
MYFTPHQPNQFLFVPPEPSPQHSWLNTESLSRDKQRMKLGGQGGNR